MSPVSPSDEPHHSCQIVVNTIEDVAELDLEPGLAPRVAELHARECRGSRTISMIHTYRGRPGPCTGPSEVARKSAASRESDGWHVVRPSTREWRSDVMAILITQQCMNGYP